MNLLKAIEINKDYHERLPRGVNDDYLDALKLGIEAIERLEDWRGGKILNPHLMLPSETEQ